MAYGYVQEIKDLMFSRHSAFEYKDLVSDKQGTIFGAKYFDLTSSLNLGQQVKLYFDKELNVTISSVIYTQNHKNNRQAIRKA